MEHKSVGKRQKFRQELITLDMKLQELMILKTEYRKLFLKSIGVKFALNAESLPESDKNLLTDELNALNLLLISYNKKIKVAKSKFERQKSFVDTLRKKLH